MKRVLVGVDGSPAARAALEWAARLAARVGAGTEVLVANVVEVADAEVSPARYDAVRHDVETRLAGDWSAPLADADVAHRTLVLDGDPDVLLDASVREDADLLVVGPRGRGGFAALHIGSLAHHLAHHARRPLAIVPTRGAQASLDRVVIGIDGTAGSDAAAAWCADLATSIGADVLAVHVLDPPADWAPQGDVSRRRAAVEQLLATTWTVPFAAAGVHVRTRVVEHAHPVAALATAATDDDAGLIVVGARGLGDVFGLRLGRIPIQLVHHAQLPVVLVPAPAHEAAQP
jgi:nucleotide-binding universal stress UspA family protein